MAKTRQTRSTEESIKKVSATHPWKNRSAPKFKNGRIVQNKSWDAARVKREADIARSFPDDLAGATEVQRLRRIEYRQHMQAMEVPGELTGWASRMAGIYGAKVKINFNAVPWLIGLMIRRYGESPEYWPRKLGPDDIDRARAMEHWADFGMYMSPLFGRGPAPGEVLLGLDEPDDPMASVPGMED